MSKASVGTAVIALFVVAMGLTGLASYRRLATLDERAEEAWQHVLNASDEDEKAIATEAFNDATLEYNRTRRRFPTILIAIAVGFPDRAYLDAKPPELAPKQGPTGQ